MATKHVPIVLITLGACATATPGYHGGQVVCGCHDPDSCYQSAADVATREGETAESGEKLMYFAQCACFQGSTAGCNTLGHFARDWTKACEAGREIATSCTMTGYVYSHGVQLPPRAGRSYDRDDAIAASSFQRACNAGSKVACERARGAPSVAGVTAAP